MTATSIDYIRISNDRAEERRSFSFEISPYHGLPAGESNHAIFRAAIENDPGTPIADVLNDTFRYLYYGHFCGEGIDLDQDFPFRGELLLLAADTDSSMQRIISDGIDSNICFHYNHTSTLLKKGTCGADCGFGLTNLRWRSKSLFGSI